MDCESIVKRKVCMDAKVTLDQDVDLGRVRSFCMSEPKLVRYGGNNSERCSFVVRQLVCVEIPLKFSAAVKAEPAGIACDIPGQCGNTPPCRREPTRERYVTEDDFMDDDDDVEPCRKRHDRTQWRYPE